MSFSLSKLRSLLPGQRSSIGSSDSRHTLSLEPEVGFELTLEPKSTSNGSTSSDTKFKSGVPELNVHLIGARHLPSLFGLKTVQGYVIKVKVFPGSTRYDSNIQTSSWPKFNENFKFLMGSETKSSIKRYTKEVNPFENLPQKVFDGHFVVFTVYALLELPPGEGFNRFRGTYRSLKEKSGFLLKNKTEANGTKKENDKKEEDSSVITLTKSESRRNIGSVTCFLDPKIFKENVRTGQFSTEELWLPIKDISVTTSKTTNINTSLKGQIELILEICEEDKSEATTSNDKLPDSKKQWSLNEVKRKITTKTSKIPKELQLKLTTSRMRCPIKVKEEFESIAGLIYVKTTIFEHNILSTSWKCEMFPPSLSSRWDASTSTLTLPLSSDPTCIDNISIKTTVATKNKMGRKVVLGSVFIGPKTSGQFYEHWANAMTSRNQPVAMWHNFQ